MSLHAAYVCVDEEAVVVPAMYQYPPYAKRKMPPLSPGAAIEPAPFVSSRPSTEYVDAIFMVDYGWCTRGKAWRHRSIGGLLNDAPTSSNSGL